MATTIFDAMDLTVAQIHAACELGTIISAAYWKLNPSAKGLALLSKMHDDVDNLIHKLEIILDAQAQSIG